jgi:YfiH family protein
VSGEALTATLPGGGQVLFSTRADGNMSSSGGLGSENGAVNREALRLRIGVSGIARGFQVHGTAVTQVTELIQDPPTNVGLPDADGQATAVVGLAAMVLAADCLPVALGCRGAVAIVHAGWRGLSGGVIEEGLAALRELGGEGPCAGACCYEVGPEVHEALGEPGRPRGSADLRAIARRRLAEAGVGQALELGGCTICDERFFSHRREGAAAGRMAGVAWLS